MKLTFIADTHHYSPTLGVSGRAYELRSGSDQKCLAETGDIIDAAFNEIARSDTNAVFILGDLTDNGERVSHIEFREKLYRLKEKKPVYVITATHDWCCDGFPRRFCGELAYNDVPVMRSDELPDFYRDFGPGDAEELFVTDIGTVCYTVRLSEKLLVLCLNDDKNENGHAGYTPECRKWIASQLENARRRGELVIGIQHHLLVPHISPLITGGSTCVENREEVAAFFADSGLRYMFVGHSHIQSTEAYVSPAGNKLTEVNVGSLVGYPAPICEVTVNDDHSLHCSVRRLQSFSLGGVKIDAQSFLARHACDLIFNLTSCRTRAEFTQRANALQLHGEKLARFWPLIKPLLIKTDTALVWDAYKLLKAVGLAAGVSRADALEYRYKPLKEMIGEVWLSALDGAARPHPRSGAYYRLVTCALTAPARLCKNNELLQKLEAAADNILTGGAINNQEADI